ncbi:disease resistance protein At4g27190-like isoform X2 [Hibiscus syriacus]|uniref:disease resistance protein At4g27190-like isoform X2 n=1 Tax=Hibiscus syriacus TaxID=106335 RepID=UPI001922235D|nr:disease resistance protein At4g27190-like isoform X2 [Hibiscus syriacus]
MDVLVGIVGSLVGKAVEYAVYPTARQLSYVFKPRSKFQNLRRKVQDLKDERERVQQSVEASNRNGEVIFVNVQSWLEAVNEKISEDAATQLQKDEEKAMKRCFAGFCPDFKSSYQLSKKADKEANAIAQLLIQKENFDGVSYLPAIEAIDTIRPVEEYEAFESRNHAFDEIMIALEDDRVSIIGVYGMGGVGKTTLVKEVAGKANERQLFSEVVLLTIKQTPDMQKIQEEIAEKLGMTISENNIDVRAARLRERLGKENRVLVILDDIWKFLDIRALGIPSADQHKGCKILITSRKLFVLKSMGSQKRLPIDVLKEDEAWNLFKYAAGPIAERSDLQSTAMKVSKKCAGLPLAITTVAKALKHKENLYEWKDALEQLKPSEINSEGITAEAYSAIEMSYRYLEREELKYTFLLCCIMGHNAVFEDLLKYCWGLGLFHGLGTMEKVRNRVLTLVNELRDSSLLLAGSTPESFDMHDVVRDIAISIASRDDRRWLALGKEDVFEEWEDTMRNSHLVSLKYAKVSQLPDELECPNLTFFSMHGSVEVPNPFFKGMQRLNVLEFTGTNFTTLPSSLGFLKTLCTLRLIGCDVEDIVILGELENLEILDLRRSRMDMLPKEIGHLTKLKLLDLSSCVFLKLISPNVLSKLSKLEELYLYNSFDGWEIEGIENPRSKASLMELQHLSRLATLEVHIPNAEAIPKEYLFLEKMGRFKISIGDKKWDSYDDRGMETSRMLKLEINKSIDLVEGIYKLLSRKIESLYLHGWKDVVERLCDLNAESFEQLRFIKVENCNMLKNLFSFSIAKRLHQLEELEVSNCTNMKALIVEKEEIRENDTLKLDKLRILKLYRLNGLWYIENTFQSVTWLFVKKVSCPALEELYLSSIGGIEKIWHIDVQFPLMSFGVQSLKSLVVYRCHKLKYIFTSSMVKSFVHLKTLQVSFCNEMEWVTEGILEATEEERIGRISVFPKLDNLELIFLPKLKGFCFGINPIEFPSLRDLTITGCSDLNAFVFYNGKSREVVPYIFHEKCTFPNLHQLTLGENAGTKDIICHCEGQQQQQLLSHYFGNLKVIKLGEHHKQLLPSYLFPLLALPNLQTLEIGSSDFKEMVFQSEEGGEEKPASLLLSQITELRLNFLLALMHLWKEKEGFPNLRILDVVRCDNLKGNLVPSSVSFRNLVTLKVYGCDGIIKLITHPTAKSLVQLKQMSISFCGNIEEIIQGGDDDDDEISFPQLNRLELDNLRKLESFCSSGNYTFSFPSLEILVVDNCPKMKMFSLGHSNTPNKVQISKEWSLWGREEVHWEGSLNSTIQQLFRQKHAMIEKGENPEDENSEDENPEDENSEDENSEDENPEEDQSNPSTSNTQHAMIEEGENPEDENSEEDQSNPSTSNTQHAMIEEGENPEEDQSNPSTSNTQNLTEEVENSTKDKGNSSASFFE